MRTINVKYAQVLLCLTSTVVQTAAFWLKFIIPRFQILDSDGAEECGLFITKPIMRQTQIYFLTVSFLF